jgi:hypothetical protein
LSHYAEVKTVFKDPDALVAALQQMPTATTQSWRKEQIEVHANPAGLYGYRGDLRKEKAEIIIRRRFVQGSANDIGFARQKDGSYAAIISEFDSTFYNAGWLQQLTQKYATEVALNQIAKQQGKVVHREQLQDGTYRIQFQPKQVMRY